MIVATALIALVLTIAYAALSIADRSRAEQLAAVYIIALFAAGIAFEICHRKHLESRRRAHEGEKQRRKFGR